MPSGPAAVVTGWQPFAVLHLGLAAVWLGAMVYSLAVAQPRIARFLPDPARREELLTLLAQGNRWPVVALVAGLLVTGVPVITAGPVPVRAGYAVAVGLQLAAAAVFRHVSWRHWPARVFALPAELPGYQHRLRLLAATMLALVAGSFLVAVSVTAGVAG